MMVTLNSAISGLSNFEMYSIVGFTSLCIGSFLNVVVYRLPVMMKRQWTRDSKEFLGLEHVVDSKDHLSLSVPRSRCTRCNHQIRPWENIPLISFLYLRGCCSSCKSRISSRYPIVEALTLLISLVTLTYWGDGRDILILPFIWALIAISLIDFDHKIIPDSISLPLIWSGLLVSLVGLGIELRDAVTGAVAGYLIPWTINYLFKILRGKNGIGDGDLKLLAAVGAWVGLEHAITGLFLGGSLCALLGISLIIFKRREFTETFPFGPFIAIATWLSMMFGPFIVIS